MAAVFPDSIIIEFYNGSAWTDISAYVVGDILGNSGLGGWKPENRVASLGMLSITLNNAGKKFSPMGGDAVRGLSTLTGFNKGAKIRVRIVFNDSNNTPRSWTVWTGYIDNIDSDDKNWGNQQVRLQAVDWMNIPSNFLMKRATIATNQTLDTALALILARLSKQPDDTDFDPGVNVFPAVFDNVKNKTTAISELNKLALSELGYVYVKADGTLRAENSIARYGARPLDTLELMPDDYTFLITEDGGNFIITQDGNLIIIDGSQPVALYSTTEDLSIVLEPDALLNSAIIRAYPVITDTSLKVLCNIGSPRYIASKGTITFSSHYTDPSGLAQVAGTNMQTPVATTDYLSNTKKDGTGVNTTSDLTVTATYYGDTVDYTLYNANGSGVWVTKLNARGYGIYYGNSIEYHLDDTVSEDENGLQVFEFDQRYQKDTYMGSEYASRILEEFKNPESHVTKMTYLANWNQNHIMSFLDLDIGSLIRVTEDRSGIDNHYYITDRSFVIKQGGIIHVAYGLRQDDTYSSNGLSPMVLEFGHRGEANDNLDYGYLPNITNLDTRTFTIWVKPKADVPDTSFAGIISYGIFYLPLAMKSPYRLEYYQAHISGTFGIWVSDNNAMTSGTWNHLAVTHDLTDPYSTPQLHINGVQVNLTQTSVPSQPINDETGAHLVLGGARLADGTYATHPFNGAFQDARIYNRVLGIEEIVTMYHSGTPDVSLITDGLVFQAPAVYTDFGTSGTLQGYLVQPDDRFVENGFRSVGVPTGDIMIGDQTTTRHSWTLKNSSGTNPLYGVAWSPELGMFAACGATGTSSTVIQTSPDGENWVPRGTASSGVMYSICWSSGTHQFVAVGHDKVWTSTNGTGWSSATLLFSGDDWYGVCYSDQLTLFVAISLNPAGSTTDRIMTSSNGSSWTQQTTPLTQSGYKVIWVPELALFVAGVNQSGHSIMTSPDGTTWTLQTTPIDEVDSLAWSPEFGLITANGVGGVITSTDGINWTLSTTESLSNQMYSMAWSPEFRAFWGVKSGGTNRLGVTYEGKAWVDFTPPIDNSWNAIAYSPALQVFIVVGSTNPGNKVMKYS